MKLRILFAVFLLLAALLAGAARPRILASRPTPPPPVTEEVTEINPLDSCTPRTNPLESCAHVEIEIVDDQEDEAVGGERVIEGKALDGRGRPLPDVPIVLQVGGRDYAVVTGPDGRFRLEACGGPVAALAYNRYPGRPVGSDFVFDSFGE